MNGKIETSRAFAQPIEPRNRESKSNIFIQELSSEDVQLLIHDVEFRQKGGIVSLIIDPFDIFRYTFPYGLHFKDNERSLDEIGDDMLAYYHVFNNYKPIILDEYRFELSITRNAFYNHISTFDKKSNILNEFTRTYQESNINKRESLLGELKESISFVLSSAVLAESYFKHFDEVYGDLQITNFELKERNPEAEKFILDVFRNSKRTDWATESFKKWVIKLDKSPVFNQYSIAKKRNMIEGAFRDFGIIDRVFSINKHLQKDQSKGKYLMLYFSSTKKSERIFSNELTKNHLPVFEGIPHFNVLRSARHAFIMFLLGGQNDDTILRALRELKEITDKWEAENKEKKQLVNKDIDIDELLEQYDCKAVRRQALEQESIARRIHGHDKFREALEKTIKKLEKEEFDEVADIFKDALEEAKKVYSSLQSLTTMNLSYSVESNLTELLKEVFVKGTSEINIRPGLDSIIGGYQHLPILLFLNNQEELTKIGLSDLLNEVVSFVVKSPEKRNNDIKDFFEKISNLYRKSERNLTTAEKSYAGALVKVFIYLISPHKEGRKRQESEAYEFILNNIQRMSTGHLGRSEKLIHLFTIFDDMEAQYQKLESDYQYFLIWTSRRNKKIEESLQLSEAAIKKNPFEPRFYHGKCLALYNKYVDIRNLSVGNLEDLKDLAENAEKAMSLYKETRKNYNKNKIYGDFIDRSIVALQNTLLYSLSLYYLDLLEKADTSEDFEKSVKEHFPEYPLETRSGKTLRKKLFIPIRDFERLRHKQDSKNFPEIAHTEAVLELCEAINYFKAGTIREKEEAGKKIKKAEFAIDKALKNECDFPLYKVTKTKINSWKKKIL